MLNFQFRAGGHCAKRDLLTYLYNITSGAGSVKFNEHVISVKKGIDLLSALYSLHCRIIGALGKN